ncbi:MULTISPECIES: hypothetical protein [unclassified Dysgonomonas]|uniref:hypothetical protein n=1 Tax=unclassified Dysgonomonas TaxID=2630389 RepID=UPI0021023ADC|nr:MULTISPECIES: hypothetical protein [unclassified Dysgonomonas]
MHVYQGAIYVHSHPYNKATQNPGDKDIPPFETHSHNAAGFFTLNQLSNLTSFEASGNTIAFVHLSFRVIPYQQPILSEVSPIEVPYFNLRAPPSTLNSIIGILS